MVEKDDSKISILIISGAERVKRLTVSKWLPRISLSLLSLVLVLSFIYLGATRLSHKKIQAKSEELKQLLASLELENESKDSLLSSLESENQILKSTTSQVEEKLEAIDELQKEVERLTGAKTPSRGGGFSRSIDMASLKPEEEMDILNEVLEDKQLEMENYVQDIKNHLSYLETVPDLMPTSGRLTSKFGGRSDPFTSIIRTHSGIDIANSVGTSIRAAGKGKVVSAGPNGALGRAIIIDHQNGYKSVYGHNSKLLVNQGDWVEKGQLIAKMGSTGRSTGSHLHFEIHKNGSPINPYNVIKN